MVGRQLRKGKRLVAHFVDLKAVFDMIHREVLCKTMRRRRIREGLVERVKEARETKNKRTGRETGGSFWTARGIRKRCPLNATLFNIMISDLEEEMGKVKWGGIRLGGERIYTLA